MTKPNGKREESSGDLAGTAWTEPGQGATVGDLHDAVCGPDRWNTKTTDSQHKTLLYLSDLLRSRWFGSNTNLRLTGAPLTAEDVERIKVCK